jgi:ubiquinol-cytochrome c reductase iron-sulfur subunit
MGCPVGLYQAQAGLLLCPCHQSTFDVGHHATPIFGPATRALPQLPIEIDTDGYVVATADFSGPVGPGFWDRDRS